MLSANISKLQEKYRVNENEDKLEKKILEQHELLVFDQNYIGKDKNT